MEYSKRIADALTDGERVAERNLREMLDAADDSTILFERQRERRDPESGEYTPEKGVLRNEGELRARTAKGKYDNEKAVAEDWIDDAGLDVYRFQDGDTVCLAAAWYDNDRHAPTPPLTGGDRDQEFALEGAETEDMTITRPYRHVLLFEFADDALTPQHGVQLEGGRQLDR